jgi:hypothetical protein
MSGVKPETLTLAERTLAVWQLLAEKCADDHSIPVRLPPAKRRSVREQLADLPEDCRDILVDECTGLLEAADNERVTAFWRQRLKLLENLPTANATNEAQATGKRRKHFTRGQKAKVAAMAETISVDELRELPDRELRYIQYVAAMSAKSARDQCRRQFWMQRETIMLAVWEERTRAQRSLPPRPLEELVADRVRLASMPRMAGSGEAQVAAGRRVASGPVTMVAGGAGRGKR